MKMPDFSVFLYHVFTDIYAWPVKFCNSAVRSWPPGPGAAPSQHYTVENRPWYPWWNSTRLLLICRRCPSCVMSVSVVKPWWWEFSTLEEKNSHSSSQPLTSYCCLASPVFLVKPSISTCAVSVFCRSVHWSEGWEGGGVCYKEPTPAEVLFQRG